MTQSNHRLRTGFVLIAVLLAAGTAPLADDAGTPKLGGTVRDALGSAIDGVEVLIFSPAGEIEPLARVASDEFGTFRLPRLTPGSYRYAAIKHGYRSLVGAVDIAAEPWLNLVLSPAPLSPAALELEPLDDAWVYRLPRRNVFRETRARATDDDSERRTSALGDRVAMELEHLMALYPSSSEGTPDSERSGAQTRLRLSSILNSRTQLELAGQSESFDSSWGVAQRDGAARDSEDWQFGLQYAGSADTQLEMRAYFSDQDLTWRPDGADPTRHSGHRSWGYESNWSMQLDPTSRVDVSLDYLDATALDSAPGTLDPEAQHGWSTRALRAAGEYRAASPSGHDVRLGVRAEMRELPIARFVQGDRVLLPEAVDNWRVVLDAEDSWALSGPFTLAFGLGYRHAIDGVDTALIVPRVGGSLQLRPLALGVTLSYHADKRWEGTPIGVAPLDTLHAADRFGYRTELEIPLGAGVALAATSRYEPLVVDDGFALMRPGLDVDSPLFRSDGDVSLREHRLGLTHHGTTLRAFVELEQGSAEGWIDPVRPGEFGFDLLTLAEMRYERGRVGLEVLPSGTDLRIEYRRVLESQLETADAVALDALELRLLQDLLRLDALGRWRLLMAFRTEELRPRPGSAPGDDGDPELLAATNRGVSAGLAVTF